MRNGNPADGWRGDPDGFVKCHRCAAMCADHEVQCPHCTSWIACEECGEGVRGSRLCNDCQTDADSEIGRRLENEQKLCLELRYCPQAMAVLHALQSWSADYRWYEFGLSINVYPQFRNQENGLCLIAWRQGIGKTLLINFGQKKESDMIFVQHNTCERQFKGPPPNRFFSKRYGRERELFPYLAIGLAVEKIDSLLRSFAREEKKNEH